MSKKEIFKLFEPELVREAVVESFKKLTPRTQIANPVMFLCWLGAILTTGIFVASVMGFSNEAGSFCRLDCGLALVYGFVRQLRRSPC